MSRRSFVALIVGLAVLCALQSWAHLWQVLHRSHLATAFDLNRSNGLPDVLSTVVVVLAAGRAAVLGSRRHARQRQLCAALALVLAIVALEDALHSHPGLTPIADSLTGITAAVGAALLVLVVVCDPEAGGRAKVTLVIGLAALAGSLLVGQLPEIDQWFERARGDPIIEYQIVVKQGLELVGWWLIALSLWDAVLQPRRAPLHPTAATTRSRSRSD